MSTHDTLLRSGFCLVWVVSLFLFIVNGAAAFGESDALLSVFYGQRALSFFVIMLIAIVVHAYLIGKHIEKLPPSDDDLSL